MKHAGHVLAVIAVALVCTAGSSQACDQEKGSAKGAAAAASTQSTKTTAVTADVSGGKVCTTEQMAACKAAKTSAAMSSCCEAKSVKTTAMASTSTAKTTAVTVSSEHAGCASKATTSMASAAPSKVSAVTASTSSAKASAAAAGSAGHCSGAEYGAMAAGSGGTCSGHGMAKAAGKTAHGDCDACNDMSACGEELTAAAAHTQVVPLKNGVMFVYTADSPSQISAVQSAMARRSERMAQFVSAGNQARLCAECKSLRTAMASGKLTREVVNIEGGALTLMTSNDPAVVAKIHAMVDVKANARIKS
jgi:hypothetical protein